jgi:hypothetical protein
MTTTEIEKRLSALEAEVASLKSSKKSQSPWWDKIAGVFADNPRFARAMLNARESQEVPAEIRRSRTKQRTSRKAAK